MSRLHHLHPRHGQVHQLLVQGDLPSDCRECNWTYSATTGIVVGTEHLAEEQICFTEKIMHNLQGNDPLHRILTVNIIPARESRWHLPCKRRHKWANEYSLDLLVTDISWRMAHDS